MTNVRLKAGLAAGLLALLSVGLTLACNTWWNPPPYNPPLARATAPSIDATAQSVWQRVGGDWKEVDGYVDTVINPITDAVYDPQNTGGVLPLGATILCQDPETDVIVIAAPTPYFWSSTVWEGDRDGGGTPLPTPPSIIGSLLTPPATTPTPDASGTPPPTPTAPSSDGDTVADSEEEKGYENAPLC